MGEGVKIMRAYHDGSGTSSILSASRMIACAFLAVWLALFLAVNLSGASYTGTGRWTYQTFPDPDMPMPDFDRLPPELKSQQDEIKATLTQPHSYERIFVLHYSDCAWNITVQFVGDSNRESSVCSYDGTKVLYYTVPSAAAIDAEASKGHKLYWGGSVEQVPVAREMDNSGAGSVWLAYASECYFKGATNGVAFWLGTYMGSSGTQRYEVPCTHVESLFPPGLPTEVYYTLKAQPQFDSTDQVEGFPIRAPFQDGYALGEFKASGSTNCDGLVFPTSFSFSEFAPKFDAQTTNDLLTHAKVTGVVTQIIVGPWQWENPAKSNGLYLEDFRSGQGGVHYTLTNGVIPDMDSPEMQRLIEMARRNEATQRQMMRGR